MDVVAKADRLPGKGESVVGHTAALSPGGKAGNQAAQAALNGARTFLIGRVGRDVFGDQLRAALARTGVDTTYLTIDEHEATGVSPVLTGADGEYASIIVPGAGQRLRPEDIDAASDAFAQSAVLLLQCEIPLEISTHAARLARSLGCRVMFDASPAPADATVIPDELVGGGRAPRQRYRVGTAERDASRRRTGGGGCGRGALATVGPYRPSS